MENDFDDVMDVLNKKVDKVSNHTDELIGKFKNKIRIYGYIVLILFLMLILRISLYLTGYHEISNLVSTFLFFWAAISLWYRGGIEKISGEIDGMLFSLGLVIEGETEIMEKMIAKKKAEENAVTTPII